VPQIGQTLREARLRRQLDISTVEERTKIRAKYLRALENEEWELLPGTTYARTFLRGYAEFLGLDAQLLVDEYVRQHAQPREGEVFSQYTEPPLAERRAPYRPPPSLSPGGLVALGVVVLVGFLFVLGLLSGGDGDGGGGGTTSLAEAPTTAPTVTATTTVAAPTPRPKRVRASLRAIGIVWVCIVDQAGKRLVNAETLQPDQRRGPFRAKRLRATFGNGKVRLRVNGKAVPVPPELANGIGYEITPARIRRLAPDQRPTCA
jgi:cytoskeleton protein RodZ